MKLNKLLKCAVAIASIGMALVACSSVRIHSDYAEGASFSEYNSFRWIGGHPLIESGGTRDPFVNPLDIQRIARAIESELSDKGFQQVENGGVADFIVSFTLGTRDKIDVDTYPSYFPSQSFRGWPYWPDVEIHSYTEGILAIDIFDGESKKPVWHGVAKKRVTGKEAKYSGPLIQEIVASIIEEFPPSMSEK